ncbi:carboxypeptidase B-like isoform X3 [Pieris napi]|uniref:carboxypeptidase B-like isoform X2 n=1 Tax=Pieris napi TaxID=78633 RepID=UPI001FBBB0D7|nr:carboxypeptidase B-like isoform X2 [Pieris napi]XP_047516092.1 carboxypeptidase B-like isoform X3 [Pieris napi]
MREWILVSLCAVAFAKHEIYSGWKSYYVAPASQEQLSILGSLESKLDVDYFVRPRVDREGVALVKPQYQEEFLNVLANEEISHRVHSEDIKSQLDIEDELIEARHAEFRARSTPEKPYDNYLRLDAIYNYMDEVAANYPNIVKQVTAGRSFEGRPVKYLKISSTNFEDRSKSIIFVDATLHAREWITPPAAVYAIHKLVENRTDPELLDKFDWIIMPVANPDGYEFSHTNERFWRKTRSTDQSPLSVMCPGVDGNRNFDIHWGTVGTSNNPCSDTYGGSKPFSEIETRLVRDVLEENLSRIILYITIHSYGSMILYPWGHDGSLSNNALGLHTVGIAMADAIFAKTLPVFSRYRVGNSLLVIGYGASGAAEDYAHSVGVPLTYTYELPGLRRGVQGFHLDPRYVRPVAEETWEGIYVGAKRARAIVRSK